MMRTYLVMSIVAALFMVTGCAPKSNYLADDPAIIYPNYQVTPSMELQEMAMGTFLKALSKYNWEVRDIDREESIVVAEACRRGNHCAEIVATIDVDGSVSIMRSPGQILSENEGNMLRQWIGRLNREFKRTMIWD